jgi:uncharacterized OB-fold protein
MLQRHRGTGAYVFYPRIAMPGSGSSELDWVEASGKGTVYATTVTRQRPEKGPDYNVALIDLAEGPRLMSRVVDIAPEAVRIGMKVRARIDFDDNNEPLLVFTPEGSDGR